MVVAVDRPRELEDLAALDGKLEAAREHALVRLVAHPRSCRCCVPDGRGDGRKLCPVDLAEGQLGQPFCELDVARNHERSEGPDAPVVQLARGELAVGFPHDDDLDILFSGCVLDADRDGERDARRSVQDAFELPCRDVLALAADPVLAAVEEVQEAVSVEESEVAGVEPEVPPASDRLLGVALVSLEDDAGTPGTGDDLADRPARDRPVVLVQDVYLEVRALEAVRSRFEPRPQRQRQRFRLRHAEAIDDRQPVSLLERVVEVAERP